MERMHGVGIAIVTNVDDPEKRARIKVKMPWFSENDESDWARLCAPVSGPDRGMLFVPEVGDEVLVAFEHGDMRMPIIVGGLWNGSAG